MQHMIDAVVVSGLFNRCDVCGFLDNAYETLVSRGTGTINAGINISDVVANGAKPKARLYFVNSTRQCRRILFARTQDVKSQALSRLTPNTRKFFELVDQASHRFSKAGHICIE